MIGSFYSTKIRQIADTGISLLFLRFFAGAFMLYGHGYGKVMNVYNGNFQFADPFGLGPEISLILAAFAEGICALFIIFGFLTRFSALVLTINMTVAVLFVHLFNDPFGGMELALLYLVVFFAIFLLGPGKYSIDYSFREKRYVSNSSDNGS